MRVGSKTTQGRDAFILMHVERCLVSESPRVDQWTLEGVDLSAGETLASNAHRDHVALPLRTYGADMLTVVASG